jgi:hypothetical protein
LAQSGAGQLPANSAFRETSNLVSLDAPEEFRIQTSTFAREYGRTPGAQISVVTKSGTNTFHGTAFEYFRNDKLDVHRQNLNHPFAAFLRNSRRTVLPGDLSYAIDPGMLNSISVPAPVPVHTSSFPPMRLARSRIPETP